MQESIKATKENVFSAVGVNNNVYARYVLDKEHGVTTAMLLIVATYALTMFCRVDVRL